MDDAAQGLKSKPHTRRKITCTTDPEGPATQRPMWFVHRGVWRNSVRSAPPPCFHSRNQPACSTRRTGDPTSLLLLFEEPFELSKLQRLRHPATMAEATTNQYCTNRRPDNRSPTAHLTRRHRGAATRRSCHETTPLKQPCAGSARTFGFPLGTKLDPPPAPISPANRRRSTLRAPQRRLNSSRNGKHSLRCLCATRHVDVTTNMDSSLFN
jgi:hypothetical protein